LQQDAERWLTGSEQLVCVRGTLERKAMGDEGCHVQLAARHQVQHGFEIALLGPAHEADRIVLPPFLVGRVVAAGTIGAADLEAQFLSVEVGPRQLEPSHAHEYDAPTLATYLSRLAHRSRALGRGGNNYPAP